MIPNLYTIHETASRCSVTTPDARTLMSYLSLRSTLPMNYQSQLSYCLTQHFYHYFFFNLVAFLFAFTNYHHHRAVVLLPPFFLQFVTHSASCTTHMPVTQLQNLITGLNNENKKNAIKLAFYCTYRL